MMECEMATAYTDTERVARKTHKCCECSAPIDVGETYLDASGVWSYGAARYRQHLACRDACVLIRDEFNYFECIGFGTLFDWWGEESRSRRWLNWHHSNVRRLRALMAGIIRRQRQARA